MNTPETIISQPESKPGLSVTSSCSGCGWRFMSSSTDFLPGLGTLTNIYTQHSYRHSRDWRHQWGICSGSLQFNIDK